MKNIFLGVLAAIMLVGTTVGVVRAFSPSVKYVPVIAVKPDGRIDMNWLQKCPISRPLYPNVGNDQIIYMYWVGDSANGQYIYCRI